MRNILIIGAGLTGLLTAYRLQSKGFKVTILEARNRIGGRIHTLKHQDFPSVEMGATWFSQQHIKLQQLLAELNLKAFPQFMEGLTYFEQSAMAPAALIQLPPNAPSYRIVGGTQQVVQQLVQRLKDTTIHLQEKVEQFLLNDEKAIVKTTRNTYTADLVISTIPPALLVHSVTFEPALPEEIQSIALATHTWMQDSIKIAVSYPKAFWRTKGISGTLFSHIGPIKELYDQCDADNNHFALCGFVDESFRTLTKSIRQEKIIEQLVKIFGEEASEYYAYDERLWAEEAFTKHKNQDNTLVYPHQNNGHAIFSKVLFDGKFYLTGTETAKRHPGYLEGAIESSEYVVSSIELV